MCIASDKLLNTSSCAFFRILLLDSLKYADDVTDFKKNPSNEDLFVSDSPVQLCLSLVAHTNHVVLLHGTEYEIRPDNSQQESIVLSDL